MAKDKSPATQAVRAPLSSMSDPPNEAMSLEDRHERIARAAYLRAAARNFQAGDPLHDWLQAEAEIDGKLNGAD